MTENSDRIPSGWYPDGQGLSRWWDGTAWTENTRPLEPEATVPTPRQEDRKDGSTVSAKGYNGQIHFDGRFVTISRKGLFGRVGIGKGDKRIPISQISSVQLKPAGPVVNGFISFSLSGGNEKSSSFGSQTSDAVKDENSVIFWTRQQKGMEHIRKVVEEAIGRLNEPAVVQQAAIDPLDQIQKLGALRDQRLITEDEFNAKKSQILGL